ncbi:hypothetical protein ACQ4PT_063472 [Festuca glaucescens]
MASPPSPGAAPSSSPPPRPSPPASPPSSGAASSPPRPSPPRGSPPSPKAGTTIIAVAAGDAAATVSVDAAAGFTPAAFISSSPTRQQTRGLGPGETATRPAGRSHVIFARCAASITAIFRRKLQRHSPSSAPIRASIRARISSEQACAGRTTSTSAPMLWLTGASSGQQRGEEVATANRLAARVNCKAENSNTVGANQLRNSAAPPRPESGRTRQASSSSPRPASHCPCWLTALPAAPPMTLSVAPPSTSPCHRLRMSRPRHGRLRQLRPVCVDLRLHPPRSSPAPRVTWRPAPPTARPIRRPRLAVAGSRAARCAHSRVGRLQRLRQAFASGPYCSTLRHLPSSTGFARAAVTAAPEHALVRSHAPSPRPTSNACTAAARRLPRAFFRPRRSAPRSAPVHLRLRLHLHLL